MKFIDLTIQQRRIWENIEEMIRVVLSHGQYIMGPEVEELEEVLAAYAGVKNGIGCSSGTDALLMSLMAYGVGSGDAIFTTPFTFVATAEVVSLLGATPVFVDIDPRTFHIDPGQLELAIQACESADPSIYPIPGGMGATPWASRGRCEIRNSKSAVDPAPSSLTHHTSHITPRGIIAVDLFGLPADYDRINAMARSHGLFVIEDAAQSFGAEYKGRKACSLAEIACTSFYPAKPLGCYGDGGMCFTDNDRLAEVMRSLRIHGKGEHKYDNVRIGINGRLDTLQAAILLAKWEIFPDELELRRQVASRYTEYLKCHASRPMHHVELLAPNIPDGYKSSWSQYCILTRGEQHRSSIQARLKQGEVPTAIYYPKPLHLQSAFACLGYKEGDFPVSESVSQRIFSLPMHPYLSEGEQEQIIGLIGEKTG